MRIEAVLCPYWIKNHRIGQSLIPDLSLCSSQNSNWGLLMILQGSRFSLIRNWLIVARSLVDYWDWWLGACWYVLEIESSYMELAWNTDECGIDEMMELGPFVWKAYRQVPVHSRDALFILCKSPRALVPTTTPAHVRVARVFARKAGKSVISPGR